LETSDPTSDLKYLHLGGNRLAGITPSSRFNQDFDLHGNNLSGGISSVIGHTNGTLAYLDFSNNRLTGSLPSTIGNLKQLVFLDLSHTNLTGSIPPSFGNLVELGHLTLDDNQLSGGIPEVLATNLI
jgi:Leucine-rich repeat (LRR) protein